MKLATKLADRLCSHQPQLRPFTKEDWWGFAGCESDSPEIAYTDAGVFVLDGDMINVNLERLEDEDGDTADIFVGEFADEAEARTVLEFLIANPGLTPKLLGESVGSC